MEKQYYVAIGTREARWSWNIIKSSASEEVCRTIYEETAKTIAVNQAVVLIDSDKHILDARGLHSTDSTLIFKNSDTRKLNEN